MGPRGLGTPDEARTEPMSAASTNFLASAELVARRYDEAVLIDMGSTTTDIIPVAGMRLPRAPSRTASGSPPASSSTPA